METVFEILEGLRPGGQGRRTGQPVRRDSRSKGREGAFWRPFSARNASRYMLAAERYDCAGRILARRAKNGRKIGPLGSMALDVLRELLRLVDYRSGRLDPALTTIAVRTGHSVAGVVAALKRLRTHGFADWLRRTEPTGNQGIRGPQVRQASNAYRLALPPRAAALLPQAPPEPVDFAHARAAKAAEIRAMIDGLPLYEKLTAELDPDDPMSSTLSRYAKAFAERTERDSKQERESPSR